MKLVPRSLACLGVAGLLAVAALAIPRAAADDMGGMPMPTTAPSTQRSATVTNTKCPVSGDAVDPAVTAVYKGKTYAFCCSDCVKAFNKDPEKYVSKMK